MNARLQIDCERGGINLQAMPLPGARPETTQLDLMLPGKLAGLDLSRNMMASLQRNWEVILALQGIHLKC